MVLVAALAEVLVGISVDHVSVGKGRSDHRVDLTWRPLTIPSTNYTERLSGIQDNVVCCWDETAMLDMREKHPLLVFTLIKKIYNKM